MAKDAKKWEFGDFQTPMQLAQLSIDRVRKLLTFHPKTIIEPTCGVGAFLIAAAEAFPDAEKVIGVEIEASYVAQLRERIQDKVYADKVELIQGDFFKVNWEDLLTSLPKPILFVGNPPWVTNADIGLIKGNNLPDKTNFQKHSGFDALTGKANFDISESMILQQIDWIDHYGGGVAMLCKTAVARKILHASWKAKRPIADSTCIQIDAMSNFGAAVDACCFVVERSTGGVSTECTVFDSFDDASPSSAFGFHDGVIVADIDAYRKHIAYIGKEAHYVWRSGVKHDCSKVMVLHHTRDGWKNGLNEEVAIEGTYLFPLLKSSDVANGQVDGARMNVIVTQQNIGDDTAQIEIIAPLTWSYLCCHRGLLEKRGSIIYRGKPPFSIFGIGDYAFEPWKVAISGFYKSLAFQLVAPQGGKPVMVDDTVYFLGCSNEAEARFLHEILSSDLAKGAISALVFWNNKRPITVDLLKRIDLFALAKALGRDSEYSSFVHRSNVQQQLVFA